MNIQTVLDYITNEFHNNRNARILIVVKDYKKAEYLFNTLLGIFGYYGMVREGSAKRDSFDIVDSERSISPSIKVVNTAQCITGLRANLVILDDVLNINEDAYKYETLLYPNNGRIIQVK